MKLHMVAALPGRVGGPPRRTELAGPDAAAARQLAAVRRALEAVRRRRAERQDQGAEQRAGRPAADEAVNLWLSQLGQTRSSVYTPVDEADRGERLRLLVDGGLPEAMMPPATSCPAEQVARRATGRSGRSCGDRPTDLRQRSDGGLVQAIRRAGSDTLMRSGSRPVCGSRSRIQTPAGFSIEVPVKLLPAQVPSLKTAPERSSSEKFQLVQPIFLLARKSRYFCD